MASDDFWQALGGFGNALSAIPKGLDAGLQPMKTLEDIQKSSISNEDAANILASKEGTSPYDYYNSGVFKDTQTNLAGGYKSQLAGQADQSNYLMNQYAMSPEGRAALQGLDPTSPQYAMALEQMRIQHGNPFGVPDDVVKTLIPAEQRGANQQASQNFLQTAMMSMKDADGNPMFGEGDTVVPSPSGGYVMKKANGDVVAVPYNLAAFAQQMEANPTLFNALKARADASNAQRTSDLGALTTTTKLGQDQTAADPILVFAKGALESVDKADNALAVERSKLPAFDSPERQQALATIEAQQKSNDARRQQLMSMVYGQAQRRGLSVGTPSTGATGQSFGGAGGLMLQMVNGQPVITGGQPPNTNSFGPRPVGGPYVQPGQGTAYNPMTGYVDPADIYSSNVPNDSTFLPGGASFVGAPYAGGPTPQNQTVITAATPPPASTPYGTPPGQFSIGWPGSPQLSPQFTVPQSGNRFASRQTRRGP
jgi:hypothetical protein